MLIYHWDLDLFLGSLFCFIDLYVCSYANIRLFWLQWPCSIVWYRVLWSLLLCSSFSRLLRLCGVFFSFHTNFWNICSRSLKYDIGILIGTELNLRIALGSMNTVMMLFLPIHEHSICFHLFLSSLISFLHVL